MSSCTDYSNQHFGYQPRFWPGNKLYFVAAVVDIMGLSLQSTFVLTEILLSFNINISTALLPAQGALNNDTYAAWVDCDVSIMIELVRSLCNPSNR